MLQTNEFTQMNKPRGLLPSVAGDKMRLGLVFTQIGQR